jgi:phosphopantetheinyl transferase
LLAGDRRLAISFSEGGGNVWAALSGEGCEIGIDAAGSDEFQGSYPLHRVFHPEELQHARKLTEGNVAEAAALLWSVKEAVVKALGCGFNLVDPRQITVCRSTGEGGHIFPVSLSGKALERFYPATGCSLWVRSFLQERAWLSIASVSRKATVNE